MYTLLMELKKECEEIVADCGLTLPTNISYRIRHSNSRVLGRCSRIGLNSYVIEMTEMYMKAYAEKGDLKPIKQTLLHEMCHALPNGMNHGPQWKAYAYRINRKYGYEISRCADTTEVIQSVYNKQDNGFKYIVTCNVCGAKSGFNRRTKTLDRLQYCSCKKCRASDFTLTQTR